MSALSTLHLNNNCCRSAAWFADMLWKHLLHLYRQPTGEDVDLTRDVGCKLAILCMPHVGFRTLFQTPVLFDIRQRSEKTNAFTF